MLALAVACLLIAVAIPVLASRSSGPAPITVTPAARVEVLLLAAEQQLAEGQTLRALTAFDAVLRLAPNNPEALAESGWLRYEAAAGSNDPVDEARGEAQLRRAIVVAPGQAAGHLYLGIVLLEHDHAPAAALAQLKIAAGLPESAAEQSLTAEFLAIASKRAR
jgi:cytochrome c-type biogenesis protein CcmH/NrfG